MTKSWQCFWVTTPRWGTETPYLVDIPLGNMIHKHCGHDCATFHHFSPFCPFCLVWQFLGRFAEKRVTKQKNGNVEGPGIHLFIYYGSICTFIYLMMTGWWRQMIRTIFITFSSGFWWRHFQSTTEPRFSATSQLSLSTGGVAAREANAFRLQCRLLQARSLIGHPKKSCFLSK